MEKKVKKHWGDETAAKSYIEGLHFDGDREWEKCEVLVTGRQGKNTSCDVAILIDGQEKDKEEFGLTGTESHRMRGVKGAGRASIDVVGAIGNAKLFTGGGADIFVTCYYSDSDIEKNTQGLEGHTYAIYKGPTWFGSPGIYCADHAYVYCPDVEEYFDCWGGHEGPEPRHLRCAGQGNYAVANCYRGPESVFCNDKLRGSSGSSSSSSSSSSGKGGTHDNACLGNYGDRGVCHQAANCFLFSAGVTLNNDVRGYWASVLAYGVYGKNHDEWLRDVYNPCLEKCLKKKVESMKEDKDPLFAKIRQLRESFSAQETKPHPHEIIIKEATVVTNHHAPEVDTSQYRELHAQFLKDKDAAIASALKGKDLAIKINELSTQFQNKVAEIIGPEAYEKLTGVKFGETINIVNPEWM